MSAPVAWIGRHPTEQGLWVVPHVGKLDFKKKGGRCIRPAPPEYAPFLRKYAVRETFVLAKIRAAEEGSFLDRESEGAGGDEFGSSSNAVSMPPAPEVSESSSVRVYELAKRFSMTSKEAVVLLSEAGFEVTSHASSVNEAEAVRILEAA